MAMLILDMPSVQDSRLMANIYLPGVVTVQYFFGIGEVEKCIDPLKRMMAFVCRVFGILYPVHGSLLVDGTGSLNYGNSCPLRIFKH
jgi:hypothetical protein